MVPLGVRKEQKFWALGKGWRLVGPWVVGTLAFSVASERVCSVFGMFYSRYQGFQLRQRPIHYQCLSSPYAEQWILKQWDCHTLWCGSENYQSFERFVWSILVLRSFTWEYILIKCSTWNFLLNFYLNTSYLLEMYKIYKEKILYTSSTISLLCSSSREDSYPSFFMLIHDVQMYIFIKRQQ
jgi:hypothetical protein